jgi:hypothetical protein
MSDNLPKVVRGEIVPRREASVPATIHERGDSLRGPTFLVARRYGAAKRKLDAFAAYVESSTSVIEALEARDRAIERREDGLARHDRIEVIRAAARHRVDEEFDELMDASETRRVVHRAKRATLELEALQAEERLANFKNPAADLISHDPRTPAERAMQTIAKLRAELKQLTDEFVASAGGELSEADQDTVRRVELATQDRINRVLEELRDQ